MNLKSNTLLLNATPSREIWKKKMKNAETKTFKTYTIDERVSTEIRLDLLCEEVLNFIEKKGKSLKL